MPKEQYIEAYQAVHAATEAQIDGVARDYTEFELMGEAEEEYQAEQDEWCDEYN
jgi:hypothetical protein